MPTTHAPFQIDNESIVILAKVNGLPVSFVLDTGDAIGPVFSSDDANRLGLIPGAPFNVSGAGGNSTSYQTTASIEFDDNTFEDEPSAIDTELQDQSLLGLPFFIREAKSFNFDLINQVLTMVN